MGSEKLDLALGILNGVVGDYLERTGNGLATPMQVIADGRPVVLTKEGLAAAYPNAANRAVLLLHGVVNTEAIFAFPEGGDYGSLLSRDFGFTPLYLRYNTGRSNPENGALLSVLLEALVRDFPTPLSELLLLGYSMGGLVVRAACHDAKVNGRDWLKQVRRIIYVGTPHRGAPLERVGRIVTKVLQSIEDPYSRLIGDIANLRSDGIKDLGSADLRDTDRAKSAASLSLKDPRHPVPLLPEVEHFLIAGSVSEDDLVSTFFGDAMVPVPSGTDGRSMPADHIKVLPGLTHMELPHHPDVYSQIRTWFQEER
jgi:pimeloyl-ACP methyl ester carboxylesterase